MAHATPAINYVFGTDNDDFAFVVLGAGMLFNHHDRPNVRHRWSNPTNLSDPSKAVQDPNSCFNDVSFYASRDVKAGEELFVSYGSNGVWFKARGIKQAQTEAENSFLSLDYLDKVGVCQGSNFVNASTLYGAGRGLFAGKDYNEGDIILISPVLLIPYDYFSDPYANTNLQNYLLSYPGSNLGVLPIGHGSLINYFAAVAGSDELDPLTEPNAKIQWHPWYGYKDMENYAREISIEDLMGAHAAPLDIAYIATQPIAKGDEILMDYGDAWVQQWNAYKDALLEWEEHNTEWMENDPPIFKSAIFEPNLYFPHTWRAYTTAYDDN